MLPIELSWFGFLLRAFNFETSHDLKFSPLGQVDFWSWKQVRFLKNISLLLFLIVDSQNSDTIYFALSFKLFSFTLSLGPSQIELSSNTFSQLLGGIRAIYRSFEPSSLTGLANQQIPELSEVDVQNNCVMTFSIVLTSE